MTHKPAAFRGISVVDIENANRLFDTDTGDFIPINGYTDTDYIIHTPTGEEVLEGERNKNRFVPVSIQSLPE